MADSSLRGVHQPVLLEEAVGMLQVIPGGVYMDGTFGLGGHTKAILEKSVFDHWSARPEAEASALTGTNRWI